MSIPLFIYQKKINLNFSIELDFLVCRGKESRVSKIIVDTLMNALLLIILKLSDEIDKVILNYLLVYLIL